VRRALLLLAIAAAQFAIFEIALRAWGHSEAAPAFQALFMPDPVIGYRLRPGARTRFATAEFDTEIAINAQGVRDDADIGPKPANERRVLVLGDSLVLSVQVNQQQTFCQLLEDRLNRGAGGIHYRVINAGVQGYGPVEERLFFREVGRAFQPDLVIQTIFVGNDAEEAVASAPRLRGDARPAAEAISGSLVSRMRRLVRRSMVLQVLRLRIVAVTDRLPRFGAPPEPPLQSYAQDPAARIGDGLRVSRECVQAIAADAAAAGARTMIMLMPARFQVDDADYGRLKDAVSAAGGTLVRDAATTRFTDALAPLRLPLVDVLPPLRAALPGPDVFFQQTVHLTPRGHEIVAQALEAFILSEGLRPSDSPTRSLARRSAGALRFRLRESYGGRAEAPAARRRARGSLAGARSRPEWQLSR
jgi:acetyltransferase AlgX (SGNH hydrolase-like protein)